MSQQETKDRAKYFYRASAADFMKIPGSPVAYWADESILNSFVEGTPLGEIAEAKRGISTGNNEKFIRYWFEVSFSKVGLKLTRDEALRSSYKWFPHNKGGDSRRWYGNTELVVNWENNGEDVKNQPQKESGDRGWRNTNEELCFRNGITWGGLTTGDLSFRWSDYGALFDTNKGPMMFPEENAKVILGFLNTPLVIEYCQLLNPTISFQNADINRIPFLVDRVKSISYRVSPVVDELIEISKKDWSSSEEHWEFLRPVFMEDRSDTIEDELLQFIEVAKEKLEKYEALENALFELFKEILPVDALDSRINSEGLTSKSIPKFMLGRPEDWELYRSSTISELISYSMGCIMGRYAMEKPGLLIATQGETLQDYLRQIPSPRFVPDDDAILPLTDQEWFPDDATNRFSEFVRVVWGDEHLQENLDFVAESLCLHAIKPKRGESALDTIRRYLSTQFFKDHLRTYKKRPIYWLFSSGKHKAFECLVYLHRYNEGTLARMRTEYVIPLSAKLNAYAEKLEQDKEASTSAAETKRLEKEIATLHKQQAELAEFDEKLRHYADQRISLDLDDGVKVNYGKFGDLLAEVKAVTGQK